MKKIEETDHLRKQLADSEVARAQTALQLALTNQKVVHDAMAAKYSWQPGDTYDQQSLEIRRADKPKSPVVIEGGKKK